jgi:hypothetical protein
MTTGQRIFRKNAFATLRDMGMPHLDPAHGAAVEAVRWCLTVRGRPTHHRQTFLERESPALLAYLEKLATLADSASWRTLEDRIVLHAEVLREMDTPPCRRRWLAAIWHTLPELAAFGQYLLDRQAEKKAPVPGAQPVPADSSGSDDGKGGGDKTGSAGTKAKPQPSRLALPAVSVVLTPAEKKAFDLGDDTEDTKEETPEGPEGADGGPGGMKGPGGKK